MSEPSDCVVQTFAVEQGVTVRLPVCRWCSAVVGNEQEHRWWHEAQDRERTELWEAINGD